MYDYMCNKCATVIKARFTPQVCMNCGSVNSYRRYVPFRIKGLTQELNRVSKEEGEE